jgi:MYXO-CTERM domain-containing protein
VSIPCGFHGLQPLVQHVDRSVRTTTLGVIMRKTVAVAAATGALLFGGAGVANADTQAPIQGSTTILAQTDDGRPDSDKTGLWGLTGLLGLLGLAGLKRRNDRPDVGVTGTTGYGDAPRA